jgi:putative toxin-antitoxin system antitoxin component (TIGR02293 family)
MASYYANVNGFARTLYWRGTGLARLFSHGKLPYNCGQMPRDAGGPLAKAVVVETPLAPPPTLLKRVQQMLGVRRLGSDQDLVRLVEDGLATGSIERLMQSGVTDDEIYALVVPRRTLTHRRARREPLSRDESDRAVRLARIAALAEQVFGDRARAWHWLRATKRQFTTRSPLQLSATEAGARLVEELLYSIDEGMAA